LLYALGPPRSPHFTLYNEPVYAIPISNKHVTFPFKLIKFKLSTLIIFGLYILICDTVSIPEYRMTDELGGDSSMRHGKIEIAATEECPKNSQQSTRSFG
jgi:hypothetical protein